ncbi:hypothetical protein [Pseudobacillus badius]|uniref:hypothetical protein n=1 Tax=Bacillus badius TaxID=1455 RepID=UPI0007B3C430|nr:hypothetical protein [Bacillus badius]KZR60391.1 hypothetical protein A3781_09470 [Bacillus badius]
MKYQVKKAFVDKNSGEHHEQGTIYETTSASRAEFLQQKGFIGEEVKNPLEQLLDQNAPDVAEAITSEHSKEELEELLELEKAGRGRKTVKEHIESLLKGEEDGSGEA